MRKAVILCCFMAVLSGCALKNREATIDMPLRKGAPIVYIYPFSDVNREATVGVLPFIVPANMGESRARGIATLFKDVLLGKRSFRTVRQLDAPYTDVEEAVRLGRAAGVDMVLAGKINYALEGTELGGARVELSVRLLNVVSGNTLWYIEQAVDQPMDYPDVGFMHRLLTSVSPPPVRKSAGAPAVPNMLARIAMDMAEVMGGSRSVRQ